MTKRCANLPADGEPPSEPSSAASEPSHNDVGAYDAVLELADRIGVSIVQGKS
ncbi:hypothetical protein [Methylovorus mays]|uniref:hypothetical protein n=1 Tax=Methylovorus mays TaxID=184077 RepID=UPI001E2E7B83|nr:hypothetical protein [Methylovorus mays]MCB5206771.1 hypothetical protein [Methylovorus mays]